MSESRVVHVNDQVEGAVYIGRAVPRKGLKGSQWANPHQITADVNRFDAVGAFYRDLMGLKRPMLALLPKLRDKPLACWCRHEDQEPTTETACHGDVLVGLLFEHTDEELMAMSAQEVQTCRVCGCTDDVACEGGCWWVEADLCSQCQEVQP